MSPNPHTYQAVLFDLDGTLVNSLHDIADSMNRVLQSNSYQTHDYESYRLFVGKGLRNLVERVLPEGKKTEATISKLYQDLLNDYGANCLKKTQLYPGIPELLDQLTQRNTTLTILSNKADAFTKKIAADLLSKWDFKIVLGAGGDVPRKPNPGGARRICEELRLDPSEVLYVGDSSVDMETAIAANMHPVGVTWGFRSRQELEKSGAQTIIDAPMQLLKLL